MAALLVEGGLLDNFMPPGVSPPRLVLQRGRPGVPPPGAMATGSAWTVTRRNGSGGPPSPGPGTPWAAHGADRAEVRNMLHAPTRPSPPQAHVDELLGTLAHELRNPL